MNFQRDDFQSVARRKKLAGWLLTLRGPAKPPLPDYWQYANAADITRQSSLQAMQSAANVFPGVCAGNFVEFWRAIVGDFAR